MPEFSGVAAVLPAPPQQESAGESLVKFAQTMVAMKQARQQQAAAQVQGMLDMASKGFYPDDKKFAQAVKRSGIPIDMSQEGLQAQIKVAKQAAAVAGANQPTPPGQGTQGGGGQQQGQQGSGKSSLNPTGMSAPQMERSLIHQIADNARKTMNMNAATAEQKAKNELTVETLTGQALNGDWEARGKLMAADNIKFNMDLEKWHGMSDNQKGMAIGLAAGMESESDKAKRATSIGESILNSGRLTNPADAYKAGKVIADGGTLPPDIQGRMKPFTFSELADQAKLGAAAIELGVPPNKLGHFMQAAGQGGVANALPTGLKPISLQTLEIQRSQLGLEQKRVGIEGARYLKEVEVARTAAAAELRKEMTADQQADLNSFKMLVEMEKMKKGSVDPDLMKGASIKAASALNMKVEEVDTLFHFLTGGTYLKFSPNLTPGGQATVDKLSGKSKAKPGIIEGISGFMKGPKEPI